ncbi:hypothetical protein [Pontibacter harenae]|uniref:hypothetical protein n=1 Tax=Pontibacter harenae TaxID=2894083 RepID=UPI001E399A74|nr:hypothetical protein [Pontibacter harenae]MCC9167209.1 hypothetical protein [Pontibacter harenae]
MEKKKIKVLNIIITLFILFIVIEVLLRVIFGFCNAVLYKEDQDLEYIAIPQSTKRFGNRIFYNTYSQRNSEIAPEDSIIIAGFGDSVLNGGTLSDNEDLATTKLSKYLSSKEKKNVKVLNVSCKSWGPDNCYAYIKKYGDFNAKAMFLVMSSHDVHDIMNFDKVVGVNPGWPKEQYDFALSELMHRYILPRISTSKNENALNDKLGINLSKSDTTFNPGIRNLFEYSKQKNIPFLIYLHADLNEVQQNEYSEGGKLVEDFCKKNNIYLIKELDYDLSQEIYSDDIHFTNKGQDEMFRILKDEIYK